MTTSISQCLNGSYYLPSGGLIISVGSEQFHKLWCWKFVSGQGSLAMLGFQAFLALAVNHQSWETLGRRRRFSGFRHVHLAAHSYPEPCTIPHWHVSFLMLSPIKKKRLLSVSTSALSIKSFFSCRVFIWILMLCSCPTAGLQFWESRSLSQLFSKSSFQSLFVL